MVTLQILVLPFLVRIRVPQPLKREVFTHGSLFFRLYKSPAEALCIYKTPLSSVSSSSVSSSARASCAYTSTSFLWCHRHRGEWWRKRGLLQFFIFFFFSHVWRCGVELERAFAGRRRAMARGVLRAGQREFFFLGREKIFPGQGTNFPVRQGANFPFAQGAHSV